MLRNIFLGSKPLITPFLTASNLNAQQLRTTFVLKRRNPVPLYKKNQSPTKLRGRHYNYELVEYQSVKKQPHIDVILTSYVAGIGRKGEIVNVAPNFAYNKLLIPGLASYVTPENIEKYSKVAEEGDDDEEKHSSQFAQRTVDMLQRFRFAIVMNKDQPWVIEPWHIRSSLRKAGFHILNDSAIELPEEKITGPDLTKQNKEFIVWVKVNNTEKARVKCRIHHWSTDPVERLPYVFEHYKQKAEPLFGIPAKKESSKTK